ncbi:MAG: efflux RND transporter periplasmic adaptor subunit [Dokdonella sp.]
MKFPFPLLTTALLILAVAGCKAEPDDAPQAQPPVPVTTLVLAKTGWSDTLEAVGTAKANESVVLTAKITEQVRKISFEDGQQVNAGDVLVSLTSGQQVAALAEAQAMAVDSASQFRRQQDLVKQGTISKSVFDTAQATRDSGAARVNALRAQLADRVVTAPFSGVLGLRQVSLGALVTPGTVITTLDDVSSIRFDFPIAEVHLAALTPGHEIIARSAAYPDREFHGTVESLDSRVDPVTRAVLVRAVIPNPDGLLRGGMLLTAKVLQPERQTLVLPEIAVVQVGLESSAFRVKADDTVEQVKVALGARRRGEVEILDGLSVGDRIVIEGTMRLREGASIVENTSSDSDAAQDTGEPAKSPPAQG